MQTALFERLVLEIETNGSVSPNDAVTQAVQILDNYLILFSDLGRPDNTLFTEEEEQEEDTFANIPDLRVDDLHFSQRTYNCLRRANIVSLRQLASVTENDLNNIRGFGRKSLNEVRDKLIEYDIHLKALEGYKMPVGIADHEGDIEI